VCIDNDGYEVSLHLGKIYRVLKPRANEFSNELRVVDEDGEDYLYPARRFMKVDLPPKARRAVVKSVTTAV
jgi:hypothetical protein